MTPLELFSNAQDDFIPRIANFAMDMVDHMWQRKHKCARPDRHLQTSIEQVLLNSGASPSVLLLALKYIQRVTRNGQIRIIGYERHMVVVAIILAHKVLEDDTYTNVSWSRISGISVNELTTFEQSFLLAIGFNLFVSEIEFTQWLLYAEQYLRHSKQREDTAKVNEVAQETTDLGSSFRVGKGWWRYPSIYGDKHSRTPSSVV